MKCAIICYKGFGSDGISSFIKNNYVFFDHSKISCSIIFPLYIGSEDTAKSSLNTILKNGDEYCLISKSSGIFRYSLNLYKYLKKGHYDISYVHGSSCSILLEMLVSKLAGVKHIVPHSHNTTGNHIMVHRLLQPFVNLTASQRFGCGKEACRWMYGEKKAVVIPNGIATRLFQYDVEVRQTVRRSLGFNDGQIVIGHVGGFNEQKNHKFLVQIFADINKRYKNVKLLSIGRGYLQNDIRDQVVRLGIEKDVLFLGQRTDVPSLFQAMDLFFLPSLFEGFPIVSIESQASGLPTFMSDRITEEAALTDLAVYLPINKGTQCWIDAFDAFLNNNNRNRKNYSQIIKDKGYDVSSSSKLLQQLLIELNNENQG